MTNDTIDQDVGVTQAAVLQLLGCATVCAEFDAAHMPIIRTICLGAHSRSAECRCNP